MQGEESGYSNHKNLRNLAMKQASRYQVRLTNKVGTQSRLTYIPSILVGNRNWESKYVSQGLRPEPQPNVSRAPCAPAQLDEHFLVLGTQYTLQNRAYSKIGKKYNLFSKIFFSFSVFQRQDLGSTSAKGLAYLDCIVPVWKTHGLSWWCSFLQENSLVV